MKNKIILALFLLFLFAEQVQACEEIYIKTADQLAEISNNLSANFKLAADIDLTGIDWIPIGNFAENSQSIFRGTLDGAGHTIYGLTNGLFGKIEGAEIRNLTLKNASLQAEGTYGKSEFSAGILANEVIAGTIENIQLIDSEITAQTHIKGSGVVGTLLGKATNTVLENINVKGTVILTPAESLPLRAVGGIAGFLDNCTVNRCFVYNQKSNTNAVSAGGLFGQVRGGTFTFSHAEFTYVDSTENIGGLVGLVQENATFKNCIATAQLHKNANSTSLGSIGGFAGNIMGAEFSVNIGAEFTNCHSFGSAKGKGNLGGFAGRLAGRSRISSSTANSNIFSDGNSITGGFVGEITNASRIELSASTGAVLGHEITGGFVGKISALGAPNTITNSYALGLVVSGTSPETTRRFAGQLNHDGINGCHAYLGMALIIDNTLAHVTPNPFGQDGGDFTKSIP